jgi:hypothetical protein
MRIHYVIVHEECITNYQGEQKTGDIIKELKRIKSQENWSHLLGLSTMLSDNIPPNSPDLQIRVCGAYREICVNNQLETLRRAGYHAKIHEEGTLSGMLSRNSLAFV